MAQGARATSKGQSATSHRSGRLAASHQSHLPSLAVRREYPACVRPRLPLHLRRQLGTSPVDMQPEAQIPRLIDSVGVIYELPRRLSRFPTPRYRLVACLTPCIPFWGWGCRQLLRIRTTSAEEPGQLFHLTRATHRGQRAETIGQPTTAHLWTGSAHVVAWLFAEAASDVPLPQPARSACPCFCACHVSYQNWRKRITILHRQCVSDTSNGGGPHHSWHERSGNGFQFLIGGVDGLVS